MKKLGIALIVICLITAAAVITATTIHKNNEKQRISVIKSKISEINKVFETYNGKTEYYGISEDELTDVICYPDYENSTDIMHMNIDPSGEIAEIVYIIKVDTSLSKQEALNFYKQKYSNYNKLISGISMDEKLKTEYDLPEKFEKDLLASEEWETLVNPENEAVKMGYFDPQYYKSEPSERAYCTVFFEAADNEGIIYISVSNSKEIQEQYSENAM